MRKIIFMMSVSLDGYFEGPDHDLRWQSIDEEVHNHFNEWLATAGGFLDGRVTYELMASHWPIMPPSEMPQKANLAMPSASHMATTSRPSCSIE